MARYATSLGKGPKKKKRDTSRKASIKIKYNKNGTREITETNDGDPNRYTDYSPVFGNKRSNSKESGEAKVANPNPREGNGYSQTRKYKKGDPRFTRDSNKGRIHKYTK